MNLANLDRLAATYAHNILENISIEGDGPKKLENIATKALGVLQENGVYAGILFLYSRSGEDKEIADIIKNQLLAMLEAEELSDLNLALPENTDITNWLIVGEHLNNTICDNIDTLLLIKQLWEQSLIYTRFSAKARG